MTELLLRPMVDFDRAYVARTWVECNASTELAQFLWLGGLYRHRWNRIATVALDHCHVRIAEREGIILGFLVWELGPEGVVVHYVAVRERYRREGIASRLLAELPGGPVTYTHAPTVPAPIPEGWRYSLAPLTRLWKRAQEAA